MERLCRGLSHFCVAVHSPSVSGKSSDRMSLTCGVTGVPQGIASWDPFSFSSTALTSLPLPSGTVWVCTHMPTTPNCISILSQRWSTTRCSDLWCAWKRSVNGWMLIDWGYLAWNTAPVVRGSMPEDLTQGRWHPDFDRGYVFGCPTRQQADFCTTHPTALWKVLLPSTTAEDCSPITNWRRRQVTRTSPVVLIIVTVSSTVRVQLISSHYRTCWTERFDWYWQTEIRPHHQRQKLKRFKKEQPNW